MSESVLSDIKTLIDRLSIEGEWQCFVWHSITEISQTRRRGSVKSDIPVLTTCVQKRMAESRVICRLSEVIYQTDEGVFRLISGHEKWDTNHQWECFIQYPATSGNIQSTSGSVSTDIKTQLKFFKRVATHFSRRFWCFWILVETRHFSRRVCI